MAEENRRIRAPARVFQSQEAFLAAFEAGTLNEDVVVVVSHQGPKSNGMPELHKLTPYLGILQNKGFNVALLTDGRMSGASGKVLAAIHVTPEACAEGPISQIEDGDVVIIDAELGLLEVEAELANRDFKLQTVRSMSPAWDANCSLSFDGRWVLPRMEPQYLS